MECNLYFVVPSASKNEAEAIGEARRIAELIGTGIPVEVRVCGSQAPVAKVFASGRVCALRSDESLT